MEISKNWGTIVTIYWRRLFANGDSCPVFQVIADGAHENGCVGRQSKLRMTDLILKEFGEIHITKAEIVP